MSAGAIVLRRFALAGIAIGASACVLRGSVASSLVLRGDDAARNGDLRSAVRYYDRAMLVDGASETAIDRLAFAAIVLPDAALRGRVRALLSRALARDPSNATLAFDAALLDVKRRHYAQARDEFERIARTGDARARAFALALARRRRAR